MWRAICAVVNVSPQISFSGVLCLIHIPPSYPASILSAYSTSISSSADFASRHCVRQCQLSHYTIKKKKKTWMPFYYSCIYCSVFKPLPCNCSWLTASFVSEELKTHLRLLQAPANLLVHISRCTATHQYRFHTTFPSTLSGGDAQIGLNVSSLMKSQTQQESLRDTAFLTSFRFPLTSFLNLSFPLLSKSLIY